MTRYAHLATVAVLVLGLRGAEPAAARDAEATAPGPADGLPAETEPALREERRALPLRTVLVEGGELVFKGEQGQLAFDLPLPRDAVLEQAQLRMLYTSTPLLAPEQSRMWLYLNDRPVAELPMSDQDGALRADIELPPDLLEGEANRISLIARQLHKNGCAVEDTADLWTSLDPYNSFLVLNLAREDRPPVLADIQDAATFLMTPGAPVEILTARPVDDRLLQAGAFVAQSLALRFAADQALSARHGLARAAAAPRADGRFPGLDQTGMGSRRRAWMRGRTRAAHPPIKSPAPWVANSGAGPKYPARKPAPMPAIWAAN